MNTKPRTRRPSPSAQQAVQRSQLALIGKRKPGRPLTYSPALCDIAVALGKQGKSRTAIAAHFNVDKSTISKWEAQHEEFSHALARAKVYEQAWWEDRGQKALNRKHFQSQVWRTAMTARFRDEYGEGAQPAGSGFDLNAFASAIAVGVAKIRQLPGDGAKPVEPLDVAISERDITASKA